MLSAARLTVDGEEAATHDVEDIGEFRALGEVGMVCREDVSAFAGSHVMKRRIPVPGGPCALKLWPDLARTRVK